MKIYTVIFLLLLGADAYSQIFRGTTVSYGIINNQIYLGADSKIYDESGNAYKENKIHNKNNISWALSSIYRVKGKFDAHAVIESIIDKKLSFSSTKSQIKTILVKQLTDIIPIIRQTTKEEYFDGKMPILTLFIATYENNEVVFEECHFRYVKTGNNWSTFCSIFQTEEALPKEINTLHVHTFGYSDSAKKIQDLPFSELIKFRKRKDFKVDYFFNINLEKPEDYIYLLIYVETKANPKKVGRPVVVAEIKNNYYKEKISL